MTHCPALPTAIRPNQNYQGRLKPIDHEILLCLIRGDSTEEAARKVGVSKVSIGKRIDRAKKLVGAPTLCNLIALEVINLLDLPDTVVG